MVSVLALNKLELRDMITAEMVENPVLEELEDSVPLLDDVGRREEDRDRVRPEENTVTGVEKKDPFEEIDFGSFFQDYLDPGYRSPGTMEDIERPSFENFLSKPGNLADHLVWQLGSISIRPGVRAAAEVVIGNLNEDGYLIASDDELMGIAPPAAPEADAVAAEKVVEEAAALGLDASLQQSSLEDPALQDAMSEGGEEFGAQIEAGWVPPVTYLARRLTAQEEWVQHRLPLQRWQWRSVPVKLTCLRKRSSLSPHIPWPICMRRLKCCGSWIPPE